MAKPGIAKEDFSEILEFEQEPIEGSTDLKTGVGHVRDEFAGNDSYGRVVFSWHLQSRKVWRLVFSQMSQGFMESLVAYVQRGRFLFLRDISNTADEFRVRIIERRLPVAFNGTKYETEFTVEEF